MLKYLHIMLEDMGSMEWGGPEGEREVLNKVGSYE